jgi:ribosome-associated toxin RatA of RatAB toxin-antitoxin module
MDRTSRRALATLALVSMAFGFAAASDTASVDLSLDQQRRVAAGEVVVLDTLPPGASESAGGGTAVALVRAAPERVWSVLVDYRGHPRYYPRVTSAEVVEADAQHALVRYEVGVGPFSFGFYMIKYPDPVQRRIDWHLDASHANNFFRENTGYWQVDPADGGSLVTYAIAVRTILPGFATLGAERESLVDTIKKLRKLVEDEKGAATR